MSVCAGSLRSFQSTHPVRGATRDHRVVKLADRISIHAPREGCDLLSASGWRVFSIFQSTHPVRGATESRLLCRPRKIFQSTHPVRGAT